MSGFQVLGQGGDSATTGFFGSDRHADGVWQTVAPNQAQNITSLRQPCIGIGGALLAHVIKIARG